MGNFRNKLDNYQSIPRDLIFDKTMSDRARFVFCYMASKPNDWNFYLEPMAKEIGYSSETLRKYINELIDKGWLEKGEQNREKGTFGAVEYTLLDSKTSLNLTDTEKYRHGKNTGQIYIDNNIKDNTNKEIEDKSSIKKDDDLNQQVEELYKLYPTKCPKRNASLGKSFKDKERLLKLIKKYTYDVIKFTIQKEIDEKYNKSYMTNFSTFLNNLPDYGYDKQKQTEAMTNKEEKLIVNGIEYK